MQVGDTLPAREDIKTGNIFVEENNDDNNFVLQLAVSGWKK